MRSLFRLNRYLRTYWYLFVPGLLFTMISAAFLVTVPIVVRYAIDSIPRFVQIYHLYAGTPVQAYLWTYFFTVLLVFAGVIIALSLVSGLFSFLMRRTVVVASRHIEFDLRNRLYRHLQTLSPAFYQRYPTGDVITRATDDIEQARRYIGPAIMYVTRALVTVIVAAAVMFVISPQLTLYALAPMPLLALSVFFMSRMVHRRSRALQEQYSKLTSRVQEAIAGIRVLKAYTREAAEQRAFDGESDGYRDRMLDLALVDSAWRPVFLLLVGLSTVIVIWMGGRLVVQGAITIGNIAEYIIYVQLMTWPVASLGFVITMVQRASASMERLGFVFDEEPDIADSEYTDTSISELEGAVAFEDVSFRYEDEGPDVLDGVSFQLDADQTLGIVGRTGAGKSTLVELIPRLLEPTAGRVVIDGRDVREIPLEVLRAHIGYVPQDVFLFSDTVGENIAFGAPDASAALVRSATREAELLGNVQDFPEGFETQVGERGITLSGGQKQRAAIARALIRDPRILIFDDALSAVDTATERRILEHLRARRGHHTLVIVSHRISAVQDADLILVLDGGRVAERGTHRELMAHGGLYADLYRKQLLEEEVEAL